MSACDEEDSETEEDQRRTWHRKNTRTVESDNKDEEKTQKKKAKRPILDSEDE